MQSVEKMLSPSNQYALLSLQQISLVNDHKQYTLNVIRLVWRKWKIPINALAGCFFHSAVLLVND